MLTQGRERCQLSVYGHTSASSSEARRVTPPIFTAAGNDHNTKPMNQQLAEKLFQFDLEWEHQDSAITETHYYPKLKEEVEKIERRSSSQLEVAAFDYALKLFTLQFVREDNYGTVGQDELPNFFIERLNRITNEETEFLWKHFFPELKMKWNERNELTESTRETEIPDAAVDSVLSLLLAKSLEFQIERLRIFFKFALPNEFWYELLRINADDFDERNQAKRRVASILA